MSDKRYQENLKFPSRNATPNDIRKYVERTLITKHDTTQAFATEVAGRWGIGRGADFRTASLLRFNKTFGDDVGPYLYRTIRDHKMEEWEATPLAGCYYYAWRAALFAAVIFGYKAIFAISATSTIGNLSAAFLTLAAPQFLALDSPAGDDVQTVFLIIFLLTPGVVSALIWKKLSGAA